MYINLWKPAGLGIREKSSPCLKPQIQCKYFQNKFTYANKQSKENQFNGQMGGRWNLRAW
jgi:hypothetical protein